MNETLLCKFTVAIEISNYIYYVKYLDKRANSIIDQLSDDLYDLYNNKTDVSKIDITKRINLYSGIFMPNMLKEEKFNYLYNSFTNKLIIDSSNLLDTCESLFVIKIEDGKCKEFNKEEIMNYFADMYRDSYYLFDIRYNGLAKKYIYVDFELHLIKADLVLMAENELYIEALLKQYSYKDILNNLDINMPINHYAALATNRTVDYIDRVHIIKKQIILDYLAEYYETSNCIFINNNYFSSLNITIDDLVNLSDEPKLIILLQPNSNQYFNSSLNNSNDRVENRNNKFILNISENLFREACGNNTNIILMNNLNNIAFHQLGTEFDEFKFLASCKNSNLNYINLILNTYFYRNSQNSFLINSFLYIFTLKIEEFNIQFNQYLMNTLKSNSVVANKFNQYNIAEFNLNSLESMVDLSQLANILNKKIIINNENILLILHEVESFIKNCINNDMLKNLECVLDKIIVNYKLDKQIYKDKFSTLFNLIDMKKTLINKEHDVYFILDTSALLDEPEIFLKYFKEKRIVIHSIIKTELEKQRVNNFNAVRAIRNINLFRDNDSVKLEYVQDNNYIDQGNIVYDKLNAFQNIKNRLFNEGKRPIIVTNEEYLNATESIKTEHISLILNIN